MDIRQTDTGGLGWEDDNSGALGYSCLVCYGSIARTDTSAKTLGIIPANALITAIHVYVPTSSNAGTTATISAGKSGGTGAEYVNTVDVKGGSGVIALGTKGAYGSVGSSSVTVTGIYAETGAASNTGGPFQVAIHYIVQ